MDNVLYLSYQQKTKLKASIEEENRSDLRASRHPLFIVGIILAFFIPIVGLIMGLIYKSKETPLDKVFGSLMVKFSLVVMVIDVLLLIATSTSA